MTDIKTVILDLVIQGVERQIRNAEQGRETAIKDSQSHKGAMESRYDTFKEEAQSLMGGFHIQISELSRIMAALRSIRGHSLPITKGSGYAIMEIENCDDGSKAKYFLLPAGGGDTYDLDGEEITILTVSAPIARALIGTVPGDEVEVKIEKTIKRLRVISIT